MACPCFLPDAIHPVVLWPHRERLPLGEGFAGRCSAANGEPCTEDDLRLHCNLGYADQSCSGCTRLPASRAFDAVRFQLGEEGSVMRLRYVCERGHLPSACGELRYDLLSSMWIDAPEAALLALAEAAVRGWQARHPAQHFVRVTLTKIATPSAGAVSKQERS